MSIKSSGAINKTGSASSHEDHGRPAKDRSLRNLIRPVITLAAIMLTLVIMLYTVLRLLVPDKESGAAGEDAAMVYRFDEYQLIDRLIEGPAGNETLSGDRDYIIEYLLDNDIDYISISEFTDQGL